MPDRIERKDSSVVTSEHRPDAGIVHAIKKTYCVPPVLPHLSSWLFKVGSFSWPLVCPPQQVAVEMHSLRKRPHPVHPNKSFLCPVLGPLLGPPEIHSKPVLLCKTPRDRVLVGFLWSLEED